MIRSVFIASLLAMSLGSASFAHADEDELVRLPGQGELRSPDRKERAKPVRLKPGAGLFITFDEDQNGRISADEIDAGIPVAFRDADQNADGYLTALEQQDWAAGLPTRDDSLANPFRFDPNLDRRVDIDEFTLVINNLGLDYADEVSGDILVADLKAPPQRKDRRRDQIDEALREGRAQRGPAQGGRSIAN
ncbi:MAG: hypothetical protein AAFR51_02000 [Pseudomonadota bacterium]